MAKYLFIVCIWVACLQNKAQDSLVLGDLIRTEFTIPQSAAFDLLGVSPAQILTPSNIKEFKVDWSFSNWRTTPNLAIQGQPVWELFYNRPDLSKYRRASYLMRTLATLDVSAGTVEDENGQRKLAAALKINIYRKEDPLLNHKLYKDLEEEYNESTKDLRLELYKTRQRLKYLKKANLQDSLYRVEDSLKFELLTINNRQKGLILSKVSEFQNEKWNATNIEFSIGKAFTFDNFDLDSLNLRGDALSAWLSSGIGLGRKNLLTALIRFQLFDHKDVENQGKILSAGINYRYGSYRYNFFTEIVYTHASSEIWFKNDINITNISRLSLGSGGDWRISRNVILTYGIRANMNKDFHVNRIIPAAGISCLMR